MKKLFTLIMVLFAATTMNAQDASSWKPGDEITDQVKWGNLSFQNDPMDYWEFTSEGGNTTTTGGLFELYDGAKANLYQVVELKAGMYRLECQAYYRCGNSWENDPSLFGTEDWEDNAQLYVQNGTYNIESKEFNGGRIFQSPVMPRLFPMYQSQIYSDPVKDPWDMSDGNYTVGGQSVWGPCSVPGSLMWFNAGLYVPASNGDVTYNAVSFFVAKDGYVKLGISKDAAKSADSFMATDFKLFYEGELDENAEFEALKDDVKSAYEKANSLMDKIKESYSALGVMMDDAIMEVEDDESTVEGCSKAIDDYNKIISDYTKYYADAQALTSLIAKCQTILGNATDADFKKAIEDAIAVESDGNDGDVTNTDDPEAYEKAMTALSEARDKFIKEYKNEDGSVEVTSYISYPWFCLPEYEPTWDAENNCWVPNEKALNTETGRKNDDGTPKTGSSENGLEIWSDTDDVNGTINNIAKGVNVYGKSTDIGVWYQSSGGNLEVYWNDNLSCIKKWSPSPTDTYHDVSQNISNIPNGYYKLKALAQTWSNEWANNCENHVYIKSTAGESHSPFVKIGGWWGKDINQWIELETDMIPVNDGNLTISSRDNGFAAFTGFRLFYYGETPDFNKLLEPDIKAVKEANSVDNGIWAGDVKAIDEILAKIPASIDTEEDFDAAMININSAKEYISNAQKAIETFNGATMLAYSNLSETYESGDESDIIGLAFISVLELGEGENDTYLDAKAATEDEAMYEKYLDFVCSKAKPVNNADLNAAIATQYSDLKGNYANANKLAKYLEELNAPYNVAIIASLGNASIENPLDISSLIINPKFEEGNKGYNGDMTIYSDPETKTTIIERWNTNSDINQTIYSLPAGTYELRAQAFYRDGGDAAKSYENWIYGSAEEMELWENKNAILYANQRESYIRSIASEKFTDTMTKYCEKMTDQGRYDENDEPILDPEYKENTDNSYSWPWDTMVADIDDDGNDISYYYTNSVQGSASVWMRHPEAYWNSVQVVLPTTGNLKFGIKEEVNLGSDWVVAHQFKLFYLGTEVPTSISKAQSATTSTIYNVGGVRQSKLQKGINILKQNDGTVRKVYVK